MNTELIINGCTFIITKLAPSKQKNLLFKIAQMMCKGSLSYPKSVENLINNRLQTGVTVDNSAEDIAGKTVGEILLDAVKGSIATMSESDRDSLIASLLECVKVQPNAEVPSLLYPATDVELDKRLSDGLQYFKLIGEVIKINFINSIAGEQ